MSFSPCSEPFSCGSVAVTQVESSSNNSDRQIRASRELTCGPATSCFRDISSRKLCNRTLDLSGRSNASSGFPHFCRNFHTRDMKLFWFLNEMLWCDSWDGFCRWSSCGTNCIWKLWLLYVALESGGCKRISDGSSSRSSKRTTACRSVCCLDEFSVSPLSLKLLHIQCMGKLASGPSVDAFACVVWFHLKPLLDSHTSHRQVFSSTPSDASVECECWVASSMRMKTRMLDKWKIWLIVPSVDECSSNVVARRTFWTPSSCKDRTWSSSSWDGFDQCEV